jgi:hypothetical protein
LTHVESSNTGLFRAAKLSFLLLFRPKSFQNEEDNPAAQIVRDAFFKSFLLVLASSLVGLTAGWLLRSTLGYASEDLVACLQVGGAGLLLWGTLFIRGFDIQSYNSGTLTEKINQWLYRSLYCIGTAVFVFSVALSPPCQVH